MQEVSKEWCSTLKRRACTLQWKTVMLQQKKQVQLKLSICVINAFSVRVCFSQIFCILKKDKRSVWLICSPYAESKLRMMGHATQSKRWKKKQLHCVCVISCNTSVLTHGVSLSQCSHSSCFWANLQPCSPSSCITMSRTPAAFGRV